MNVDTSTASEIILDAPELETAVVGLVHGLNHDHLDSDAAVGLDRLLRDQIALQVGISQLPWSRRVLSYIQAKGRAGQSRIVASALKMSAEDAAFVNAAYGHGFEYDDAHGPSNSHPGSCVIPAAFAIGEELGSTLGEVLDAIVVGYEVYGRIGALASPLLVGRGFQPHAVLSPFGAAAVAARLRGFDAETTLHALAIALSFASGTTEYTSSGGSIKRVHAGIGTRNGMAAADLAQAGLTGPRAFLTGPKGFFRTFIGQPVGQNALERFALDRPLEIGTAWLKAYCSCYCTHSYIDAVQPYESRHQEIERIEARITPAFNVVVGTANASAFDPQNIEHVQYSLPAQMAFAILGLGNGYRVHHDYMDGKVDMKPVLEMARRITIIEAPELEERYRGKFVADVTLVWQDGTQDHIFVEAPVGSLERPLSEDEQNAKFFELTNEVLGEPRAQQLLAALQKKDRDAQAADLMALCATA